MLLVQSVWSFTGQVGDELKANFSFSFSSHQLISHCSLFWDGLVPSPVSQRNSDPDGKLEKDLTKRESGCL